MTTKDLHPLLDELADTHEVVLRRVGDGLGRGGGEGRAGGG